MLFSSFFNIFLLKILKEYSISSDIMDKNYGLCLDAGGTSIKAAIIDNSGNLYDSTFKCFNINTNAPKEEVINTFINIINYYSAIINENNLKIKGIGIGICGPFDYKKGICLIPPKLHKYKHLYGINLKEILISRLGIENIVFENDAFAFLWGETWKGQARKYNRVIGLTLGTGLGSAFYVNGEIVVSGKGVPPDGWVGGLSYKDGIVEDYIARRWILSKYRELSNNKDKETIDVVDIAKLAYEGDKINIAIFSEMGERLGEVISPFAEAFQAECIVFGGQISNALPLFIKPFREQLKEIGSIKNIYKTVDTSKSALYGMARLIFR
ncbi:MAG: ROK family protein [Deferribacterota bacterium]|nr:ROK family protein [Deferribacterota bacterium]